MGIRLIAKATPKAVDTFNRLSREGKAVSGGFHLTCWYMSTAGYRIGEYG
jgi:hypothetical protein